MCHNSIQKICRLALISPLLICFGITGTVPGFAAANHTSTLGAVPSAAPATDLDTLEVRIWTAEDHELAELEHETVRFLQINPGSARAHYLLTHVITRQFAKDPSDLYVLRQASDLAQQAIDLAPNEAYGYVAMADILDLMGNTNRGLSVLTDAENYGLEPNWRFYFTRARLSADASKTSRVFGLFETAMSSPNSLRPMITPYVIALLQSTNQGEQLIQELNSWNARFPSPLIDLTIAITYSELKEPKRAHEIYTSMIQKGQQSATTASNPDLNNHLKEAMVNDAVLLYRDLNQAGKATVLFEQVLRQYAKQLPDSSTSMIQAHLGAAYAHQKKYHEAETSFTAALGNDANKPAVIDFITKTYRNLKAYKSLAHLIQHLNNRLQGSSMLHALLGETLSEHLAQHEAAVSAFSDAITLDPSRSDYYNGMGLAYYRTKRYPDALKLFAAATEVDPNDATARYNQACVLSILGRSEEAMSSLTEAISLDPRLAQNAKLDEDFRDMRGSMRFRELVQIPGDGSSTGTLLGH